MTCNCKPNRRTFLGSLALGTGGLMLGGLVPRKLYGGAPVSQRRFIFTYFEGGWDQLLGLDPRDPQVTTAGGQQIDPAYGQLAAQYQARGLRGVQRSGNLAFGPAVPPDFITRHAAKMSIVNGIGMDTASHEVGRRYFITGQFPRGTSAVGSSAPAEIVAQLGERTPIPNLAAGVEAYARGLPSYASPLAVNSLIDLLVALRPFVDIQGDVLRAVQDYQDLAKGCEATRLDRDGLATQLLDSQQRARSYIEQQLDSVFDIARADPEMAALRNLYGIADDPASPEVLAFAAAQAVKQGISQCVSVTIANSLDTHSNWATDQAPLQERGWQALSAMLTDLENTPLPEDGSRSMLDETTVLAFSEFARTPLFNNIQGRDHFLGNSCLVAGAGIRQGVTIGKSAEVGMMPEFTNLDTGAGVTSPTDSQLEGGRVVTLSPKHVLATVLASANLDHSYLRVDPIAALLR